MGPRRHRLAWLVVGWTIAFAIVAGVMAAGALAAFNAADQRCFMDYPSTPCPGTDDPALLWLQVALFGLPAVWLVGVIVALVDHSRRAGVKRAS